MSKKAEDINLELIRIARELVLNEYTDNRAKTHNKWLVESDFLWRTQRLRLVYPDIPPHPTEEDIIRKAKTLMTFVQSNKLSELISNKDTVAEEKLQPTPEPTEKHNIDNGSDNVITELEDGNQDSNSDETTNKDIPKQPTIDTNNNTNTINELNWNEADVHISYPELKNEKNITNANTTNNEFNSMLEHEKNENKINPDDLLQVSNSILKRRLDHDIEFDNRPSRMIPSLIKKLDEMKKNLYGN